MVEAVVDEPTLCLANSENAFQQRDTMQKYRVIRKAVRETGKTRDLYVQNWDTLSSLETSQQKDQNNPNLASLL